MRDRCDAFSSCCDSLIITETARGCAAVWDGCSRLEVDAVDDAASLASHVVAADYLHQVGECAQKTSVGGTSDTGLDMSVRASRKP